MKTKTTKQSGSSSNLSSSGSKYMQELGSELGVNSPSSTSKANRTTTTTKKTTKRS
ncbi:hypothetical protein [Desulfotomaculum sp. 1211_IL3151]|uniref:hypothetical protein n=1 Tax=Desulfotomaculum sp. 1211_IL3151 TaxID=3084055 RepID=UPI002FD89EFC